MRAWVWYDGLSRRFVRRDPARRSIVLVLSYPLALVPMTSLNSRYPQRARGWQLRQVRLEFDRYPRLMGIVNVTPDSFSDGGRFLARSAAIEHGLKLAGEGADLLDIGGESTRPYAAPVSCEEELRRVIPVIEKLVEFTRVPISIDTSKAEVAEQALQAGAQVINDVTGLEGDPRMIEVARRLSAGVCAMHMKGRPSNMQDDPRYDDLVAEIDGYLGQRRDALVAAGIDLNRICLDPGIGFGKTHQHNLTLHARCSRFHHWGCPLLVGHSRKGYLGKILGDATRDRTWVTVGAALSLARAGVQVIRVHEVQPVREALIGFVDTGGVDECERSLA